MLIEEKKKKGSLWRFKLALIHRVNQKEILLNQLKFVKILLNIMIKVKKLIEVASLENEDTGGADDDEFQIKEKKEGENSAMGEKANKNLLTTQDFKKIYVTPCEEAGEVGNEQQLILHRLILRFYLQEYLQN